MQQKQETVFWVYHTDVSSKDICTSSQDRENVDALEHGHWDIASSTCL